MARPKRIQTKNEIQENPIPVNVNATDMVKVIAIKQPSPFGYAYFIGDSFILTKEEAKKLHELGVINYR